MRIFTSFAIVFSFVVLAGCSSSVQLGSIGDESLRLEEFEEVFARNNGGRERASKSTLEERKSFLDLFVAYKLKLREARERGLRSDSSIIKEIAEYRTSVASTYILEKELIEPAVKMLYERKTWEIRASHLLLRLGQNPSPEDTLRLYNQARDLIAKARIVPFDSLARQFSQDPSVATNGGDLGWFSQGRMVRPFEDAAYSLSKEQVSPLPVRTQFGYHVIKVTDRQPHKGSVQISHFLKRFSAGNADSTQVRDTVNAIYRRILDGTLLFEDAVVGSSDDQASRQRFGSIGAFDRGRLPPDLVELLFSTPVKSITPPYRAAYGYHIFRVTGISQQPPFEQMEKDLRQYYEQQYYVADYENYLHALKNRYNLQVDLTARYDLAAHSFDSTKSSSSEDWASGVAPQAFRKPLFTYADRAFTVGQFLAHVRESEEFQNSKLTPRMVDETIDRIVDSQLLDYHASTAGERHPALEELLREYENGVLIYRLDQDEVWSKIQVNDSLLHIFYNERMSQFQWPERVNVAEIHLPSDSIATAIRKQVLAGQPFEELAAKFTRRPGFKEKGGVWGLLAIDSNELTSLAASMAIDSLSNPFRSGNGWSIIKVIAKEPPGPKTFEEALSEVTSKYQEHASKERERQWIESLKIRYGVKVNPEKLSDAFKTQPAS
ncbi:MAG: peptidylprolyl isomerase [Bacteroidota bacterium]